MNIRTVNFQIDKIGLIYIAHYNKYEIRVYAKNFGFNIQKHRVGEFCNLFPDINWEDGQFIEVLKGRYMRALIEDDIVKGVQHITDDLTYMIEE